jgi:hypothetical protein
MSDATGDTVYFDRDATVVIALKENLGLPVGIPAPLTHGDDIVVNNTWPNPARGIWNISVTAKWKEVGVLTLHDSSGKALMQQGVELMQGVQQLQVDVSSLASGYYSAELRTAHAQVFLKLMR